MLDDCSKQAGISTTGPVGEIALMETTSRPARKAGLFFWREQ